jgi:hypothetical protein
MDKLSLILLPRSRLQQPSEVHFHLVEPHIEAVSNSKRGMCRGGDEPKAARRAATATARRGGLAAWKKRGSGCGMEIGPGRRRFTTVRTAGEAPESGRMPAGEGSGEREDGNIQFSGRSGGGE